MSLFLALYAAMSVVLAFGATRRLIRAFWPGAAISAAAFAWFAAQGPGVLDGTPRTETLTWVEGMGFAFGLRLDAFSWLMSLLVTGIGALVFAYSASYFSPGRNDSRFAATLLAFSGSMLGLVISDNLFTLFLFWELTSVTSYLLIGFNDKSSSARASALQAFLITGMGGLAMLAGFVLIGSAAGTYSMAGILAAPPADTATGIGLVLVLAGAFTKSAQAPFHSWLPGAMAAPTPVSAYLHSATMVKAGVYLIARFAPAFAEQFPFWRPLVLTVGATTMLLGGYRALRQTDLKLLLAYGTVSQLGFLVLLVGAGHPALTFAGVGMIVAHALFKAALFLVVGEIDRQAKTRDLGRLTGLGRRMPGLAAVAALGGASMIGLPPLMGYLTKESALEGLLSHTMTWPTVAVVAGSVLTFAYTARFLWGGFADKPRDSGIDPLSPEIAAPSAAFAAPAQVLAAGSLVLGIVPAFSEAIIGPAASSLSLPAGDFHLYLWHGFTPALALTTAILVAGAGLFWIRSSVERWQWRLQLGVSSQAAYEKSIVVLNQVAVWTTAVVQNGSLPTYIAVILLAVLSPPAWILLTGATLPAGLQLTHSPIQLVVVAGMSGAALACAYLNRRFAAVLMLGAVGYCVALLFVMLGAPDLALTQLLIETLSLVMFVLVLRHLPEHFSPARHLMARGARLVIAAAVGCAVFFFAVVLGSGRETAPVSEEIVARSLPEGGGRNVVNVILTDFRAIDTLGEVTVLIVAALGVASLMRNRPSDPGSD